MNKSYNNNDTVYWPDDLNKRITEFQLKPSYDFSFGGFGYPIGLDNGPIKFQTPWCKAPFGVDVHLMNQNKKFSLTLNVLETTDEKKKFAQLLRNIDTWILDTAIKDPNVFFGKDISEDQILKTYNHALRFPKPKTDFPFTFKMKIPVRRSIIDTQIYIINKKDPVKMEMDDIERVIPKGCMVRGIIQISPIWVMDSRWGVSFKPLQLQINHPAKNTLLEKPLFKKKKKTPGVTLNDAWQLNLNDPKDHFETQPIRPWSVSTMNTDSWPMEPRKTVMYIPTPPLPSVPPLQQFINMKLPTAVETIEPLVAMCPVNGQYDTSITDISDLPSNVVKRILENVNQAGFSN